MATSAAASDLDSQISDLQDEIQMQNILLASLSDVPEDTSAKRREFLAEILTLKKRLENLEKLRVTSKTAQAATSTSHSNMSGISGPHALHGSHGSPYSIGHGNDRRAQSASDEQTRKRTYSNHTGTAYQFSAQKSRKNTPDLGGSAESPFDNPSWGIDDMSSFVDLTGLGDDDGTAWKQRQTAEEERFKAAKKQQEQDRMFALSLQRGEPVPSNSASNSASSTNRLPSLSGPTAFDQIQGRTWQFPQVSSPQSPAAGSSSRVKTEHVKREPTYGDGVSLFNDRHMSEIPTRIKPEDRAKPGNRIKPEETSFAAPSQASRPRMPGSYDFDSEDDSDPLFSGLPSRGTSASGFSNGTSHPGSQATSTLPPTNHAVLPQPYNSRYPTNFPGTASSHVYGQPQHFGASGMTSSSSVPYNDLFSAFNPPMGPRPGSLVNGSANLLATGHRNNLSAYQTGRSLADVVDLTNGFDYHNGTDHYGNRLPEHIMTYVEDYVGDEKKTLEQIQDLLANVSADMEVPPEGQEGSPEGLKVFLYRHQKIALKWMEGMESKDSKGGILADDMGLGKTISTIALMLSRRVQASTVFGTPSPIKTNVIVGPVALLRQWEREIKKKVNLRHELTVHNYHQKKIDYKGLCKFDVVLVTYGTLAAEWKKYEKYMQDVNKVGGGGVDQAWLMKNCPFLGNKSTFHRVILDEAQCIKNRNTKAATACRKMQAEYRWCLTGTPMMNNIGELSSLIEFLRIEPFCDYKKFNKTFGCLSVSRSRQYVNVDATIKKLQILLKGIMLRRSKSSMIDGKPIINLPPKVEVVDHVAFDEDEKQFYQDLERESQVKVSKYLQQGTIGKHYSMALVLLLRLRQACCHPYLHLTDLDYGSNEIPEDVLQRLAQSLTSGVVDRIKAADGAFECPICYDSVLNPSIMLPCGHDTCADCLLQLTGNAQQANLQNGVEGSDIRCPECRGPIDAKKVITYEIFKQVHMPETVARVVKEVEDDDETQSDVDSDSDDDETQSEEDGDDVDEHGDLKNFVVNDDDEGLARDSEDDDDIDDELDLFKPTPKLNKGKGKMRRKSRKSKKSKGKKKEDEVMPHMLKGLRKEAGKNNEAHRVYMRYLKKIWRPSAKVEKCKELIAGIQETGEKTIVFSQWTLLLDLLEIPIKYELGLGFRRYDGGMSSTQRDNAVNDFIEKPDVKVILVSLKAGNAGLNLTAASQVIIMDPFWNPYIEMQAIDRAHRIGQNNTVKVHRVLVEETVEDRIVLLQENKRKLVDSALDEGAAKGIGRLSHDDIAYLFGFGGGLGGGRSRH